MEKFGKPLFIILSNHNFRSSKTYTFGCSSKAYCIQNNIPVFSSISLLQVVQIRLANHKFSLYLLLGSFINYFNLQIIANHHLLTVFQPSLFCNRFLNSHCHLSKKFILCFNGRLLAMTKNAFHFMLKTLFVLKMFELSSQILCHDGNG